MTQLQRRHLSVDGYEIGILENSHKSGRRNILCSTGTSQPAEAYPGFAKLAETENVVIAEICGHQLGSRVACTVEELAYVHSLIPREKRWTRYGAVGHSLGGNSVLNLLGMPNPPEEVSSLGPVLPNAYTRESIKRKVYAHAAVQQLTSWLTPWHHHTREHIAKARRTWELLDSDGDKLLDSIVGKTWEELYPLVPSEAAPHIYISSCDYLFPATAEQEHTIRTALPQGTIVRLEHSKYTHGWPEESADEVDRLVHHHEQPVPPGPHYGIVFAGLSVLGASVYLHHRYRAGHHDVREELVRHASAAAL